MDIGQLTLIGRGFNNNHGAVLQAYALHKKLSDLGYYAEIIDFVPSVTIKHRLRIILGDIKEKVKDNGFLYIIKRAPFYLYYLYNKKKSKSDILLHEAIKRRFQSFEEFKRTNFIFTEKSYTSIKELKELSTRYDAFLVGSDTVWCPRWRDEKQLMVYLISFSEKGQKISYAASVGDEKIPKWACKIFRKYLPKFGAISVRERTSAEAIRNCTGITPRIVVDPTILLEREEWDEIAEKPSFTIPKPYILVYDLYNSNIIFPIAKKLANELGAEIVTHSKTSNLSFYECGPKEFLWLFKRSEAVITSSFHGAVFASIYEKPFYAIDPTPYAPASRIKDFLETIKVQNLFLDQEQIIKKNLEIELPDIDWREIREKLQTERKKSLEFLEHALGGVHS